MASHTITGQGISSRQAQAVTDTPVMPGYTLFSPNYLKLQGTSDNGYYVNFSAKYVELQGIGCFFASGRGGGGYPKAPPAYMYSSLPTHFLN